MNLLRKLFGQTEMTWKLLLIYSIANGVVVALLNCIPLLENTSFTYPAATLEYWFIAAIFIIVNCKSAKEASLKTFLFFLISQPLIYLVEVPFKEAGWELFRYYPYWGYFTILTIPGAWIAYWIKKDHIIAPIILSVATSSILAMGVSYFKQLLTTFPYNLVAAIFCIVSPILLIEVILKNKKHKIIAYIITILFTSGILYFAKVRNTGMSTGAFLDSEHQWEIVESDVSCKIDGNFLDVSSKKDGTFYVTVQNEDKDTITYQVIFKGNMASMEAIEDTVE